VGVRVGCEVWYYPVGWDAEKQMKPDCTHFVEALVVIGITKATSTVK
jgi:hypothetical protein